ncbi:hypothetical protein D915_008694 [Fasciola hepatica]|uniref:Uncharacterized protein n=1 Tax=Fasciola hepatica TaxID=6192 RepID=A0A4E0RTC6_FASHE|nr:hypothetical protein D915_008694 [Fasciola hepatica]
MLPCGGVSVWFWRSWLCLNTMWIHAIHPRNFTVKLTTLMHCDQIDKTLLGCDSKKMYPIFSELVKSSSVDMELRSVRCLHEEPNETSRLLQFELDMIDVKKFGLDADSDQKILDLISSEMTDPSCFFQSLDVQYPVEKGKCRK